MHKNYYILTMLVAAVCFGLSSCKKPIIEEKDAFTVNLTFKASPTLPQSIPSRFRVGFFTDGLHTETRDVESVKVMNEGISFKVVRGNEFEFSAAYGWPYGTEWYQNGDLSIPFGQMMPPSGGAYLRSTFPSDKEAIKPFALDFKKLYYEFPVMIDGPKEIRYTVSFDCKICGFTWPEIEPIPGVYHYETEIKPFGEKTREETVRIPAIEDTALADIIIRGFDREGVLVYGPEKEYIAGSTFRGENGEPFFFTRVIE